MNDQALPRVIGKKRKEPDLKLIASAIIDLVLNDQEIEIVEPLPESEAA